MIDGLPDDLEATLVRDPLESAARLIDRLAELGWSSGDLARLMGDNILRVLDATADGVA